MISEKLAFTDVIYNTRTIAKFKFPTLAVKSSHKVLELETLKTLDTMYAHHIKMHSTNKVDET